MHRTSELSALLLLKLEHLGNWGYWAAFAIAFLEGLAFVGTFIPGSTIITLMGFLAFRGLWDVGDLIWFVAAGAILGDILSYWLGMKGVRFFKDENKYLKESHLKAGEEFFARHGDKSVFLGRFLSPVRAVVPFVAGLSKMNKRDFIFWDALGGISWAMFHLYLGYASGKAIARATHLAHRVELIVTIVVILGVTLYFLDRANWRKK
jgi:membrane protein DedA with SNARE-associated domain